MTFRADETICPAHALKILGAGIVVRKNALEFRETCWKAAGIHCWMLETRLGLSSNRIGKVHSYYPLRLSGSAEIGHPSEIRHAGTGPKPATGHDDVGPWRC